MVPLSFGHHPQLKIEIRENVENLHRTHVENLDRTWKT